MMLMQKIAMYSDEQLQANLTALVERHSPMVKRIAHHLQGRLPANVQINDLIQSGMVGLLEAARKYDASKGASFETFASIRVRGAMLDDVRKEDWAPRSVHRNARNIAQAIKSIEGRTGRDAQDTDIAEELGISLDDYYRHLQDSAGARLFSFDDITRNDESVLGIQENSSKLGVDPFDKIQQQHFKSNLAKAIATLPDREKLILALYYREELNLKEIGNILGVSESRVSQIHSQAALRLRSRLVEWQG